MSKFHHILIVAILFVFGFISLTAQEHPPVKVRIPPDYLTGDEARTVNLYREILPTVVTVFARQSVITSEGREKRESLGSGVLISPEGHVLTAAHVVNNADTIILKTHDGKLRPAELVFSEPSADIALLRLLESEPGLMHARLGDSDRLAVGQMVYATGSPFGLENSFSVGHISGFREFNRLYDGTILAEFIQTDAAINSGSSGGPLFNSRGEVIGIASQILTTSGGFDGLGFVVAINTAKQILALDDRPWMGFEAIFLGKKQLAELFHLDRDGGLLVQRIATGSPADLAGLRGGSILARIQGQDILLGGDLIVEIGTQEACHNECLIQEGSRLRGADRIPVKFLRGGSIMEIEIDVSATRRNFLKTAD